MYDGKGKKEIPQEDKKKIRSQRDLLNQSAKKQLKQYKHNL